MAARACGRRPERTCTRSRSTSGIPGPGRERLRPNEHRVPAGQVAQRAERSTCDRQGARMELDRDQLSLLAGLEQLGVDSGRHDAVVAGKALRCRGGRRLGGREQGVDASEQLLSQRAPRRIAEPLGREERGDAERFGVAQGEVRDARQSWLEAVDDVEASLLEREVEVRTDADRDAQRRPARHGHAPRRSRSRRRPRRERALAGRRSGPPCGLKERAR